jgi:hypothetical protein
LNIEVVMPKVDSVLTIRSLGEVAWLASRVGRQMISAKAEPAGSALRDFWQSLRSLQQSWTATLDRLAEGVETDENTLENVAVSLFTTEMAARVWATILAGIDQETGKSDLSRIALNSVNGLMQVRHQLMSRILALPVDQMSRAASLDRIRRRCDRWTDLLIGHVMGHEDIVDFAFDPERARDFAEECRGEEPGEKGSPVELLVEAGLRLGFLGQLPDTALTSPQFQTLIQSILICLPQQAFERDGSLISRRRSAAISGTPSASDTDVLLPGISVAGLRKRFG